MLNAVIAGIGNINKQLYKTKRGLFPKGSPLSFFNRFCLNLLVKPYDSVLFRQWFLTYHFTISLHMFLNNLLHRSITLKSNIKHCLRHIY